MKYVITFFLMLYLTASANAHIPYYPIKFPRDEGAHYDNLPYQYSHMLEWWYMNGRASAEEGKHIGFSVTLVNASQPMGSGHYNTPFLLLHLSDLDEKKIYGLKTNLSFSKHALSTKDVEFDFGDKYQFKKAHEGDKTFYLLKTKFEQGDKSISFDLKMEPIIEPMLIFGYGFGTVIDDMDTYYYAQPKFFISGTFGLNGKIYHIKQDSGEVWLDRQWGDFTMPPFGWEFFSVRFDNGMIGSFFTSIDTRDHHIVTSGAHIVMPDGENKIVHSEDMIIERNEYWHDEKNGFYYPTTVTIRIPSLGLVVHNSAAFKEQDALGYWEGYCEVTANYLGQALNGFSYTEFMF